MRKLAARILPWLVTIALLAFLFWRTPVGEVLAALQGAAGWTLPVGLLGLVAVFFGDSFAIHRTFGWFVARLRFCDVLVVRGATYLLAAINYSVGQGAIVYFVHRVAGVPLLRGAGTVLLIMGTNILLLLAFATVGLWAAPHVLPSLSWLVVAAYAGLLVYGLAVSIKPRWLRDKPVLDVLFSAGLGGYLKAMLVRFPHLAALLSFNYAMLLAFGIEVPPGQAILTLPVVYFIAVLPISVQGLGTSQAAMVFFFSQYAPGPPAAREAVVLASSLTAQAMGLTFQCLVAIGCLRTDTGRMLREGVTSSA